jgi:hypothetical protein
MRKIKNTHKIVIVKTEKNSPLGRPSVDMRIRVKVDLEID